MKFEVGKIYKLKHKTKDVSFLTHLIHEENISNIPTPILYFQNLTEVNNLFERKDWSTFVSFIDENYNVEGIFCEKDFPELFL